MSNTQDTSELARAVAEKQIGDIHRELYGVVHKLIDARLGTHESARLVAEAIDALWAAKVSLEKV